MEKNNSAIQKGRVPECAEKLEILESDQADMILDHLKKDKAVLIKNVKNHQVDDIAFRVASEIGLGEKLETQAGFSAIKGHREKMSKYFMSVNKRRDYQFVAAHSEGDSRMNMQMAAFYCLENDTDGGETILLKTKENSPMWSLLRETVRKYDLGGRRLSQEEIMRAKLVLGVNIPEDLLGKDDEILSENEFPVPGIRCFNVLKKLEQSYSEILKRNLFVYWDNVASLDFDGVREYYDLLKTNNLLKQSMELLDVADYDSSASRRLWYSGMKYDLLFESKVTQKLAPGDLIFINNLTWAHSVTNWTPASGQRRVIGAFA